MITGFFTFILWLVVNAVLMAIFGVTEKPKRVHYLRNGILYVLITVSLAFGLIVIYKKYWDYLMFSYAIVIFIILMLIGLFSKIPKKQ